MSVQDHSNVLSFAESLARLGAVSIIQFVGFCSTIALVKWGPRWFKAKPEADWQRDCLWLAYLFGIGSLVALFLTLAVGTLLSLSPQIPETVIRVVFGANTIFFALGMLRTGGPSRSFFAQLVPIQLSGILVLEQQKAMMTNTPLTTWKFALFSTGVWFAVVLFRKRVAGCLRWKELSMRPGVEKFSAFAATFLFVLSVAVTVLAYWLPVQPWFIAIFRRPQAA